MNAHLRNTGATLMWDVFDVFNMSGCVTQCARKVHNISPLVILSYHHYFSQLPKYAKLQWIVDYINTHSTHAMNVTFMISGKIVCQSLWMSTLGICTHCISRQKRCQTVVFMCFKTFIESHWRDQIKPLHGCIITSA